MAKFGAPSQNKIKGQGGHKAPGPGYSKTTASQPGGTPTGSAPGLNNKYVGIHVPPVGSSAGRTISKPKPFKSGGGTDGAGKAC